jgi:hypothetical protein
MVIGIDFIFKIENCLEYTLILLHNIIYFINYNLYLYIVINL